MIKIWRWMGIGLLILLVACQSTPISEGETAVSPPTPTIIPTATTQPTPTTNPLAPASRRLQMGELQLAADEDAIPAIFADDSIFVDASTGDGEWADDEFVVGVEINGDARAYPIRLMSQHELVNDNIGGQPVLISWCPLCFSAIVYDRLLEREMTFGVSGFLYFDNLVMYDHQTNTLWSQLLGQGIKGAMRHEQLQAFPSIITTWAEWKQQHPDTRIISATQLGEDADAVDPYNNYYLNGVAGITGQAIEDGRLSPKSLVIGLTANKLVRAYSLESLRELEILNDTLGETPLLFLYNDEAQTAVVYQRAVAGQELTFVRENGRLQDTETGSTWDAKTGTAVDGTLLGEQLPRISAPLVYWFAWSTLHQGTELIN